MDWKYGEKGPIYHCVKIPQTEAKIKILTFKACFETIQTKVQSIHIENIPHMVSCGGAMGTSVKLSQWIFFSLIHMCIHCLGHFSPPPRPPPPPLSSSPAQFQADTVFPLSLILLKRRHKHNKEDKVVLLVELRIATQRDSYHCFHVPMYYDPCWFNSNWSLHWFLIPCSW
jgi:hypothetical protein